MSKAKDTIDGIDVQQDAMNALIDLLGPAGNAEGGINLAGGPSSSSYRDLFYLLFQIIEHSYDGFVLTDSQGGIFYVNEAVEKISGISRAEIVGKHTRDLLKEGLLLSNSTRILNKNPLTMVQKVKTGVEVFITSVPFYGLGSEPLCYVANYRNIAQLNKLRRMADLDENGERGVYRELTELRNRLLEIDDVIIKSKEMKHVLENVIKVSQVDANVLLTGESGTGKEVIAKLIHKYSPRKEHSFVQINCGAIPATLIESELFGYEKGAFTGAQTAGKTGILEVGHNGTVLLDEIGDLPLSLQVKLLRFLENQEIYRVGGVKPIRLNVRVIAVTNKNLKEMVEEGSFREDLFYRLNVAGIAIPPLRERRDDIVPLACYYLNEFKKKYNVDKSFSADVCDVFENCYWPGNVRELRNVVEKLVIFNNDSEIKTVHLPQHMLNRQINEFYYRHYNEADMGLREAKEVFEKEIIKRALEKHKSVRKAAKAMKINHSNVIRKARKYNINMEKL